MVTAAANNPLKNLGSSQAQLGLYSFSRSSHVARRLWQAQQPVSSSADLPELARRPLADGITQAVEQSAEETVNETQPSPDTADKTAADRSEACLLFVPVEQLPQDIVNIFRTADKLMDLTRYCRTVAFCSHITAFGHWQPGLVLNRPGYQQAGITVLSSSEVNPASALFVNLFNKEGQERCGADFLPAISHGLGRLKITSALPAEGVERFQLLAALYSAVYEREMLLSFFHKPPKELGLPKLALNKQARAERRLLSQIKSRWLSAVNRRIRDAYRQIPVGDLEQYFAISAKIDPAQIRPDSEQKIQISLRDAP